MRVSKPKSAKRTAKRTSKDPMIGKQFRSLIADCSALWEVKSSRGRGAYVCEVVNEPIEIDGQTYDGDFAGHRKVFGVEEIERALRLDAFAQERRKVHEDFYAGLALGAIVHYHNGFGQFVRCEVVRASSTRNGVDHPCVEAGDTCLKTIALVGAWMDYDLRANGYHVKGVLHGQLFRPNASNVWEHPAAPCHTQYDDPSSLEAIKLR